MLSKLRNAGRTIRADICQLGKAEVSYPGHVIGEGFRRSSKVKTSAMVEYRRSTTKNEIRAFLVLLGYYQHYIANFSMIANPLTDALRKTFPEVVKWDDSRESSIKGLSSSMTQMIAGLGQL